MNGGRDRARYLVLVALVLLAAGCHRRERVGTTTTSAAATLLGRPGERPAVATSDAPPLLEPLLRFYPADGLRTPAAIIHDEESDVYLLSNVDGAPNAPDNKGFISKLTPDGKRVMPRWIESGRNGVVLNAPKGMAIRDDELFVADIDTVRIFDRVTGAPRGEVAFPGTTSLHSVALAPDRGILVSEMGSAESGTDGVYVIYREATSTRMMLIAKPSAAGPTGLVPTATKLWTIGARSGELFSIDNKGKIDDVEKLPYVGLEGIVALDDDLLVSSSAQSAILRGKPGGPWRIAIGDVKSAGDIGYDHKRGRVLVPLSSEDEARIYELR